MCNVVHGENLFLLNIMNVDTSQKVVICISFKHTYLFPNQCTANSDVGNVSRFADFNNLTVPSQTPTEDFANLCNVQQ